MDDDYLTYQFDQFARQEEITAAVEQFKQVLLTFLGAEIYFTDVDNDGCGEEDCWYAAKKYAFEIVRDFIETGVNFHK